jgi:hypothetical protein
LNTSVIRWVVCICVLVQLTILDGKARAADITDQDSNKLSAFMDKLGAIDGALTEREANAIENANSGEIGVIFCYETTYYPLRAAYTRLMHLQDLVRIGVTAQSDPDMPSQLQQRLVAFTDHAIEAFGDVKDGITNTAHGNLCSTDGFWVAKQKEAVAVLTELIAYLQSLKGRL